MLKRAPNHSCEFFLELMWNFVGCLIEARKCRECSRPFLNGHMVEKHMYSFEPRFNLSLFSFIGNFIGSFVYWNQESRVSLETFTTWCFGLHFHLFLSPSPLWLQIWSNSLRIQPAPRDYPPPPLTRPDKKQLTGWNFATTSTFRATSFNAAISFLPSIHDEKMKFNGITISLCPLTLVGEPE